MKKLIRSILFASIVCMTVFYSLNEYAASVPVGYETTVPSEEQTTPTESSGIQIVPERKEKAQMQNRMALFPKTGGQLTNAFLVIGGLLVITYGVLKWRERHGKEN